MPKSASTKSLGRSRAVNQIRGRFGGGDVSLHMWHKKGGGRWPIDVLRKNAFFGNAKFWGVAFCVTQNFCVAVVLR